MNCCKECYIPERDGDYQLPSGHTVTTAYPEGCKDEDCPCHCVHVCTSMCRHNGCNCLCGEFHDRPLAEVIKSVADGLARKG